jgi:hypothetical protein
MRCGSLTEGWHVTAVDISAVAVERLAPSGLDRATVLCAAAHALRFDGRLLVVDHDSTALWSWNQDPDVRYQPHGRWPQ